MNVKLSYLLDTNICIYIAKQKPLSVLKKFQQLNVGQVGMSMITYGELFYGAQKSQSHKKTHEILEGIIQFIPTLPLPPEIGKHYGEIRAMLEQKGKLIGNNDLWIAAHALSINTTLVTNNVKEFSRIPKLKVENWVN